MNFLTFLWRVARHWGALVTGGIFIGALGIYQGVGHTVPHWFYWTIAGVAVFVGSYLAWFDQYERTRELEAEVAKHETEKSRLEMEQLEHSEAERNSRIVPPTMEEVRKFSPTIQKLEEVLVRYGLVVALIGFGLMALAPKLLETFNQLPQKLNQ